MCPQGISVLIDRKSDYFLNGGIEMEQPNSNLLNDSNLRMVEKNSESIIGREDLIIELLKRQNELLEKNLQITIASVEKDDSKRGQPNFYSMTTIKDFDMSISSMIGLSFKWLVASIPVGIVIGILWMILAAIIGL